MAKRKSAPKKGSRARYQANPVLTENQAYQYQRELANRRARDRAKLAEYRKYDPDIQLIDLARMHAIPNITYPKLKDIRSKADYDILMKDLRRDKSTQYKAANIADTRSTLAYVLYNAYHPSPALYARWEQMIGKMTPSQVYAFRVANPEFIRNMFAAYLEFKAASLKGIPDLGDSTDNDKAIQEVTRALEIWSGSKRWRRSRVGCATSRPRPKPI